MMTTTTKPAAEKALPGADYFTLGAEIADTKAPGGPIEKK